MEKNLTIDEANKIIAEYMFPDEVKRKKAELYLEEFPLNYSTNLDDLIPVWEKTNLIGISNFAFGYLNKSFIFEIYFDRGKLEGKTILAREETLQEAACIATAKTIKELYEKEV